VSLVEVSRVADGQVLRLALSDPPRNVLAGAMLRELTAALAAARDEARLKAILLTHQGAHFSYGASVAEHTRAEAPAMLDAFHGAVRALCAPQVPVVAAVRGQCLGAGMELVALATHVVAAADAKFGQPEIKLGAFAPVASVVLPWRIGQRHSEDLLLTGRVIDAEKARAIGLCDDVAENPEEAALAWIWACLLPHSASSLRVAWRAARLAFARDLETLLPEVDRMYRQELLPTADAEEGIRAFMEKRLPKWSDR